MRVAGLAFGAAFGFVITAAGLNNYEVIHRMLLLRELDVYLLMASAVAVAAPLLWLLEHSKWRTPLAGPIVVERSPVRRSNLLGAVVFGTGWAISGACPGPAIGMAVAGNVPALAVIGGLMTGIIARDRVAAQISARDPAGDGMLPRPQPIGGS